MDADSPDERDVEGYVEDREKRDREVFDKASRPNIHVHCKHVLASFSFY